MNSLLNNLIFGETNNLANNIYKSFVDCTCAIRIFLDLAKEFDTVNHEKLFDIMEDLDFRGVVLKLFKSYLNNMKHFM